MPFYKKRAEKFKTGKLDIFVIIVVFIVFMWAFFVDSWKPYRNETGEIVRDYKGEPIPTLNLQVIIAPIILCYEALLITLEGKYRGRYLPWGLYYSTLKYVAWRKAKEGKDLTREWLDERKKKK